ncbi:hypothetical protein EVAR_59173_1 [Eumeta japonica]|uniref:Uncharacterized protein n=1 Tax=Eumeta variegata TaxID=151549 RepID=A0A4C1YY13_EUMVA|nr:hypothetical protein EVAR_59173_1 [Eumeta japonica]
MVNFAAAIEIDSIAAAKFTIRYGSQLPSMKIPLPRYTVVPMIKPRKRCSSNADTLSRGHVKPPVAGIVKELDYRGEFED